MHRLLPLLLLRTNGLLEFIDNNLAVALDLLVIWEIDETASSYSTEVNSLECTEFQTNWPPILEEETMNTLMTSPLHLSPKT